MKYNIFPILQTEKLSIRGLSNLPKLHSLLGPEMGFKPRQPPTQGRPHYMENQYSKREGDPFILLLIWGVCLSSINDYIDADFKIFLQQYFLSPMQHESRVFFLMQILIQNI